MAYRIYTIQLGQWRKAKEMNIPILDITAKSGTPNFAPDYRLVMMYKDGMMTQQEYTEEYINKMRDSVRHTPIVWNTLTKEPVIALGCYCKAGSFCHRHIFKELMEKYLVKLGHTVLQCGEIQ